ncbi:unnamed protein product [Brassica oleracea]
MLFTVILSIVHLCVMYVSTIFLFHSYIRVPHGFPLMLKNRKLQQLITQQGT